MSEQEQSEAQAIAAEYARGDFNRRDAIALLAEEGVIGVAAHKMLADAEAAVKAGG